MVKKYYHINLLLIFIINFNNIFGNDLLTLSQELNYLEQLSRTLPRKKLENLIKQEQSEVKFSIPNTKEIEKIKLISQIKTKKTLHDKLESFSEKAQADIKDKSFTEIINKNLKALSSLLKPYLEKTHELNELGNKIKNLTDRIEKAMQDLHNASNNRFIEIIQINDDLKELLKIPTGIQFPFSLKGKLQEIEKAFQDKLKITKIDIGLFKSLKKLIETFTLSNTPTDHNYSQASDIANYYQLEDFIKLLENNEILPQITLDLRNSNIIENIKIIRDNQIKQLEILYAIFDKNKKIKEKAKTEKLEIPANLEETNALIAKEMENIKNGLALDIESLALPKNFDLQEFFKNNIQLNWLNKYPPENIEDILNFLIIFYFEPTGEIRDDIPINIINLAEPIALFDSKLKEYKESELARYESIYNDWQKIINKLNKKQRGTVIYHAQDLNFLRKYSVLRLINRLLISNYDLTSKQFKGLSKEQKQKLENLVKEITRKDLLSMKLKYKDWLARLGK